MADQRITRLRAVPLFAGCSDDELRFIMTRVDEMDFPAGKVLCRKGESGGDFFVILDGQAEVETSAGKHMLGPGEFFGEIALLDNGPRSATVTAATPMHCLVLGHEQFRDVLHQKGDIALKVLRAVTHRLRETVGLPTG
ncbi:MAG: cyclic nucleotide-binding domain-containing protein [Chloroflexi bacterium]|nr:MAG: cyclic nucleotide-binding domain-containing protein [Chloroflexota bacterium]